MVGEQAARLGPVAGGLQMPDCVDGLGVFGEPACGQAVRFREGLRAGTAKFRPEQVGEHAVVAEPGAAGVE